MTNTNNNSNAGIAELFHMLESNNMEDVDETKKIFHRNFLSTKDSWLVNGLFDYYLSTNSLRAVEVLAGVREPHEKHLFDKLYETLSSKSSNNNKQKIKTLVLLSHVARKQPTWLYKLTNHSLFKQLLLLLKMEEDIVLIISALLLLITLIPMLPTALMSHLQDIFEVFSRLALFQYNLFLTFSSANVNNIMSLLTPNFTSNNELDKLYCVHLQIGLQHLFNRLYAMYPCNFIAFLRNQYQRDQVQVFKKIISPMLNSVRMHPLLVTMSKDSEISSSRWKKMEHHDVVAECGRFSVSEKSNRDEAVMFYPNSRFTPISDSCPYTPSSIATKFPLATDLSNGNQENFWSPSMTVSGHSPTPTSSLQATPISHDARSTPSTPGGLSTNVSGTGTVGGRVRISPPEAAVEATPETTPVKDLRQSVRPISSAVRALGSFGNGSSRPSTPISTNTNNQIYCTPQQQHHHHQYHHHNQQTGSSFLSLANTTSDNNVSVFDRKIGKILAERQNAQSIGNNVKLDDNQTAFKRTSVTNDATLNGRTDSWQHKEMQLEDQEVSDIVSSTRNAFFGVKDFTDPTVKDLSRKERLKGYRQYPTPPVTYQILRRTKSCPDVSSLAKVLYNERNSIGVGTTFRPLNQPASSMEDTIIQNSGIVPYECFLNDLVDQRARSVVPTCSTTMMLTGGSVTPSVTANDSKLSPTSMLDRYIEVCAQTNHQENKSRPSSRPNWSSGRRSKMDDEVENGVGLYQQTNDDNNESNKLLLIDQANLQIQLMQMQLQFERQRREVHAERNRRLLGKLRDSRALEEINSSMTHRLKLADNEIETLKSELTSSKTEARIVEKKLVETVQFWQNKCKEEQQLNSKSKDRIDILEDELKKKKKKLTELEKQTRAAEATLFEAAHQLKEALRGANQSEELKRVLDVVQKKFILLGEAQAKMQERMVVPVHMAKQETALMQKAWSEEVSNLRRQLESQMLQFDAVRSRLAEFENKYARKEVLLVDQQRILQETKERHSAELEAIESKYRSQMQINLMLEGRILELYGKLEQAIMSSSSGANSNSLNLGSSVSPKERSPPLSTSLASSSEGGSLAFIHSAMNDSWTDNAGEISNLQAIVEPVNQVTSSSSNTTTPQKNSKPTTTSQQR